MSILINHKTFLSLSKASQEEILKLLNKEPPGGNIVTAFDSASLTFGKPLVLPNYNNRNRLTNKSRRMASDLPDVKVTDLYTIVSDEQIKSITEDIDNGFFISNSKSINWSKDARFNPNNWEVKRIIIKVKTLQPTTSLQIDQSLPTMDRYRVTSILRELRKQGILIVN